MAAGVAKRYTDGARKGHDKPGLQQVKPGRSSRRKQPPAQDKDEGEDVIEPQRKSQRIQEKPKQNCQQALSASPKASLKSPRPKEKQSATQKRAARGGQTRYLQKAAAKQDNRSKEKIRGQPTASPAAPGVPKSTKRQPYVVTGDEQLGNVKRPTRALEQHAAPRTGHDKESFIETWLNGSSWFHREPTEDEPQLAALDNMAPPPTTVFSFSNNTLERMTTPSRKSGEPSASVHDSHYRESLGRRNIYINHDHPPAELMKRARTIISKERKSPGINDKTAQMLVATLREVENEPEADIMRTFESGIIPAANVLPDKRLTSNANQLWSNCVSVPLDPTVLTVPLPLPRPKPDLVFGYSNAAFTRDQLETIPFLIDDQFGRSYAVPDWKVRFPFLQFEFKSQAKGGTHYIAANQAAGAGAIATIGKIDLVQRSFGMKEFDYHDPQYFSVTMDHELARINVHWLRADEGGRHSFHVETFSNYLLNDANAIRAVSRAIQNILDWGTGTRLEGLCTALDAYRELVVHSLAVTNPQRAQESEVLPPTQSGTPTLGRMLPPDSRGRGARHASTATSKAPQDRVDLPTNVHADAHSRHSLEDGHTRRRLKPTQKVRDNIFQGRRQ
ncbi:hypothetical protein Z517_09457 [Fonsecaea pedrosoi CBS 271.37]|uniref:DUF7924 domain-containing protein n=1 Tax=Fonsecaea pedrosoi CBS 271.37 TaxID=1442368 RepID=A0A0D2ES09_9EURO|nr:uncharacterized protein Z517_09457 [Fonsecaea pedrosoi CBS 271.37]KIW77012.1 hypothetical protein Z517_09457 [Fonsecaea pedrosoi CBS 271.37]